MTLQVRTGLPGSGKTLSIIDEIRRVRGRPVFYYGIPDLSPSLGWTAIEDPKQFHELVPNGAIFILDEAQQHFPVRAPRDPVPPALASLETHRHRALDIYMLTQDARLLDHHIRRLAGSHVHFRRNFGANFSNRWEHNRVFNPEDYHQLKEADKKIYNYPRDVYSLYTSAEDHTVVRRLPMKALILPISVIITGVGIYFAVNALFKGHSDTTAATSSTTNAPTQIIGGTSQQKAPDHIFDKTVEWQQAFKPAIPGLPYTAPFYNDLAKPVALPHISGCVATEKKCACYTQQATVIDMPDIMCRNFIKHAAFDPFKAPVQIAQAAPIQQPQQPPPMPHATYYQPQSDNGNGWTGANPWGNGSGLSGHPPNFAVGQD